MRRQSCGLRGGGDSECGGEVAARGEEVAAGRSCSYELELVARGMHDQVHSGITHAREPRPGARAAWRSRSCRPPHPGGDSSAALLCRVVRVRR